MSSEYANRPRQTTLVRIGNLRRWHQAIREEIGKELLRRYQPPQDLPDWLRALLLQINGRDGQK